MELERDSKLPVICNINHLLYRPPLSAPSPTNHQASPHVDLGSLGLIHVFRFVFALLSVLNQRSSLATLHTCSITVELGSLLEPQWQEQHGWSPRIASDLTIERWAPDPCYEMFEKR